MPIKLDVLGMENLPHSARGNYTFSRDTRRIILSGNHSNVKLDYTKIEKFTGKPLDSLQKDLIDIATIIYIADKFFIRDTIKRSRDIKILIPVRNLLIWNSTSIKTKLTTIINEFTSDNFEFNFIQGTRDLSNFEFTENENPNKIVSLFSGGLDSLAGVKWAFDNGLFPVLVTHYASGKLGGIQNTLISQLETKFKNQFTNLRLEVKQKSKTEIGVTFPLSKYKQEYVQYSRSFLFLSLASLVALSLGIKRIFMFENGILAINVPSSQSKRITSTKTTHPKIIEMYKNLINELFSVDIQITNPFIYNTKGEMMSHLTRNPFKDLVKLSVSCTNYARQAISNCGICYPCLLRRVSLHKANLITQDSAYRKDIFNSYPKLNEKSKTLIFDLFRFMKKFTGMSDEEIISEYFDFYIEGLDPNQLISMYKRYGTELYDCFNTLGNTQLRKDINKI